MPDGRSGWNEMAATYDTTRALPGDGERRLLAEGAELDRREEEPVVVRFVIGRT